MIFALKAADVIHAFWVPYLHGKKKMIPGREATIEFRADKAGVYRGQCAEFCSYEHALMAFSTTADPPARYAAWAAQQRQPAAAPVDALALHGCDVSISQDCARCHNVRGTDATGTIGPNLTHLARRHDFSTTLIQPSSLSRNVRAHDRSRPPASPQAKARCARPSVRQGPRPRLRLSVGSIAHCTAGCQSVKKNPLSLLSLEYALIPRSLPHGG